MKLTQKRLLEIIEEEVRSAEQDVPFTNVEDLNNARTELIARLNAADLASETHKDTILQSIRDLIDTLSGKGKTVGLQEYGGAASNFGGKVGGLGAARTDGVDISDHDLYGPQQNAEDNFIGILIDIGQMLEEWQRKQYPSDEARSKSYYEDLQNLLGGYDPCVHHGEKCDDVHPNQSHEECIQVTINDGLQEGKKENKVSKKISHLKNKEKKPHKQAVAMALNMEKEGRLTKDGKY